MAKIKIGIIGKDGRTNAVETALQKRGDVEWRRDSDGKNMTKAAMDAVRASIAMFRPDFVFIGPEEPLEAGVVDVLWNDFQIPCIGPTKRLAQVESSKAFTRRLVQKYGIPGNPEFRVFTNLNGVKKYLDDLASGYVIKPDGLTGGKGVKVSDVHLFSIEEGVRYCEEIFVSGHSAVVIEEKLDGEEFSLMSFCDGRNLVHMPLVQDHKRVGEGDTGPNTGGMGSYSCADHSLPFVRPEELLEAQRINQLVANALLAETGEEYKGILYGGFMITSKGLRLLEYNARFGDPETMNVLSILESDLVSVFQHIIAGTLDKADVRFKPMATVCKYIVPDGYPENPKKGGNIDISELPIESEKLRIYEAAVDLQGPGVYRLSGSRALGIVGIAPTIDEAESIAESAAQMVRGPVFHRKDIGTAPLIEQRIRHVANVREKIAVRGKL